MNKLYLILIFLTFSMPLFAAKDFYSFNTHQDKERFEILIAELRCLVCQNQNLAESNAPLANDLRDKIVEKINHGQSNEEIIRYLVDRYGNFILYKPPLNISTLGLWFSPFFVLVLGVTYLILYIRKKQRE